MRRAAFVLAVVVAFVTTYVMVLPALTLDSGTAADEPGIRTADSGDFVGGDTGSRPDSGSGGEDDSPEFESWTSGGREGSGEDSSPDSEAGTSGSRDGGGEDAGNGKAVAADSDDSPGDGDTAANPSEDTTGDTGGNSAGNADGDSTGNSYGDSTGDAEGNPAGNTEGNPSGMNENNPDENASGDDESGTGTDQGSESGNINQGTAISDPGQIAAGAGVEIPADNPAGSSTAGEGSEENQEKEKDDPGYDDSDLTELECRVQDILLRVDAEEGVLQDGVNLKAESLDSDDVLKAARDAGIIDDKETEEKKGLQSKVRFGFAFSFRDAEDCRYDLPEEVTVRARRDADRTEEYLDEDHKSTPGQRLDDFLEIFREYADGDREALKGWHMIVLDGEDAEKAKELGYEEDALCLRTDRDLGFAVICTEDDLMPARSFEGELDDIRVSVEAPEGAFPRGTTMKLSPVESEEIIEKVQDAVNTDKVQVKTVQAVDITFCDKDGNEIEPTEGSAVKVSMYSEKIKESEAPVVVHVDDEGQAATMDDATVDGETVEFETDQFSIYAIVGTTIEKTVLASDGKNYRIVVTYWPEAGIPENADLEVSEILQETEVVDGATVYENYIARTREALGMKTGVFLYARFFDIKIVDGNGEKVNISAPVDVKIELADQEAEEALENIQVVHFADDAETGDIVNGVNVEGDEVSFEAEGFSAYAVVAGPEPVPFGWEKITSIEELMSRSTEGLFIGHPDGYYYGNTIVPDNKGRTGIAKTKPAQVYPGDGAAAYYFEAVENEPNKVYAYCLAVDGTTKQYVYNNNNNSLSFTGEEHKTAFTVSVDSSGRFQLKNGNWYWNMQGGANGTRFCSYNVQGDVNNDVYIWYRINITSDPYGLDGTSYGLMNWNGGTAGKALMNSSADNHLDAKALTVMSTANNSKQLFVPNDSEISMWTFHWTDNDNYHLTTVVDGSTKYLKIDENGLSLVSEPVKIRVVPGTGTHAGEICLKSGNQTLTYSGTVETGFSVGGSAGTEWLRLVKLSELTSEYFMTYSASKVSVSDEQKVTNGSRVIVYTRSWNEEKKQYDFYAIGSDGTLVPVYENGDSIEWVSGQINQLLWNFVEYYWEGTSDPNYYYELYNQYSEKFVAPQITGSQTLSDNTIGINLNGRRDGKYYSTILAWDEQDYSYVGLKVENGRIVTCPKSEAMDFYFAIMEDVNVDDVLHTVPTVDHKQYGITMKIIDLENDPNHTGDMSQLLGNSAGGTGTTLHQGLLSTNLGTDGYPTAVNTSRSLGEMYSGDGLREVNHLFIESTYKASGYFEYDSTQNYAYLEDSNNFKIYKELGTYDSAGGRNTLKHGQFFPFNDLEAGVFASVNGKNLYTFDATNYQKPLPDSDPRKYEQLYNLENSKNPNVDTYFAMELEAGFTQTESGEDAWNHDIIFEFTGDDDFWLYVDGELVIDLGGIHSSAPGSVNFKTGEVKVNRTTTTLRDLFYRNYYGRYVSEHSDDPGFTTDAAEAAARKYVDGDGTEPGLFEKKGNNYVFRDYSNHTMRIFYMERGAGASNLQMRFNLAAVKKGTVQLNKELAGVDDPESVKAEFPYQILYKTSEDDEVHYLQNHIAHSPTQNDDYVTYKDSVKPVKYLSSNQIDGCTYNDVFFLKPGETADITFPEGMIEYRIVECGINTDIYSNVTVNGSRIEGEPVQGSSTRKDFGIAYATTENRAKVNYVNTVNPHALRTLTIKKKLYDETGIREIDYIEDGTYFTLRLYLASEYEELDVANMQSYHVKDPSGCYCRWNRLTQKFEKIGEGVTDYTQLTPEQRQDSSINFTTSIYGTISKIPAGYSVEVRNILAGTQYRVEERRGEIPDGYSFQKYEYNNTGAGKAEEVIRSDRPGINGTVVSKEADSEEPFVDVCNLKGWGLRLNKIWSDADYMSGRDAAYFAVYTRPSEDASESDLEMVPDTLRLLAYKADPQTLYWYFLPLPVDVPFNQYEIREVKIKTGAPDVDDDGYVTNIDSLTFEPISHGGELKIDGKQKGEEQTSEFTYSVLYGKGKTSVSSNVRVDTVSNNRPGIVLKKAKWDGNTALSGAAFTLEDENKNLIGTFTSDEEGMITVAFLRDNVPYTLTETSAPQGWYGLQSPITITLNSGTITAAGVDDSWYEIDNTSDTPVLTVKDRPCLFRSVKKDGDTDTAMEGVTFALHRQVTVDGVTSFDLNPMPGYESLVTTSEGIIPKIDNTLPAGTYELRETTPTGYQPFPENAKIRFKVSETGAITMVSTDQEPKPEGVELTKTVYDEDPEGKIVYQLIILNHRPTDITLKKADDNNTPLKGAVFKLCKYIESWVEVEGYGEVDMTDTSEAAFKNLTPGLYQLTETKAPDGYIILSEHVYFNIGFDSSGKAQITLTDEKGTGANANSSASVSGTTIIVKNTQGTALPHTGGPGTRFFCILGLILIAGAGILISIRRTIRNY